jgi:hypothetical protein
MPEHLALLGYEQSSRPYLKNINKSKFRIMFIQTRKINYVLKI